MSASDFLIGIKTKNFVLMCNDRSGFFRNVLTLKTDADKSFKLGEKVLMLCVGQDGDPEHFGEYVVKNLQLYKMRNQYELSPKAAAHWTRRVISENLRTQDAYAVFLLLGGYDTTTEETYLTSMDYIGTQFETNFVSQGFGGKLCNSILDDIYNPDWTLDEAKETLKTCLLEVKKRLSFSLPEFQPWVVDKDGIHKLDIITI